jgi:hypothetical protein
VGRSSDVVQISGAQNAQVPCVSPTKPFFFEVVEAEEKSVDPPKSVNLIIPVEERRILSGFRSLWHRQIGRQSQRGGGGRSNL